MAVETVQEGCTVTDPVGVAGPAATVFSVIGVAGEIQPVTIFFAVTL